MSEDSPVTAVPIRLADLDFDSLSVLQRENPLFEDDGATSAPTPTPAQSVQPPSADTEEQAAGAAQLESSGAGGWREARVSREAASRDGAEGSQWARLPPPVLRRVLNLLSWQDVRVVRMICKEWRMAHGMIVSCLAPTRLQAPVVAELFPALMVLDLTRAAEQPADSLKQQLLELSVGCQYLGSLKLPENLKVDDLLLAVVASFTALTSLSLEGTTICTDSGSVSNLSMLQHLQALNLARAAGLSDLGVESLSTLPAITHVSLSGCFDVTSGGAAKLGGISSLTSLNLEGCGHVDDHVLAHFANLTNLQALNLSFCSQVSDKGLEVLCEGITAHSLYAAGNPLGAIGAAFGELGRAMSKQQEAGGLKNLRSLSLSGCTEVTDHGISKLKHLASLTSLDILGCWMVTGHGIASLTSLHALESLSIEVKEGLDNACLGAIASLGSLKHLRMERCHLEVTDHGIEQLEQLHRIEQLELTYCTGLSDIFIATIGHLPQLLSLNLLKSQTVSQGGLAALNTLRKLQELDLTGCQDVNDIVFLCLKPLPLTSLSLAYCGTWTDEGLASLAAMSTLRHLDMGYTCTAVTDTSLGILSRGLTALSHLSLRGASQLSNAGVAHLAHNQKLERLDLEGCIGISDAAVASISQLPSLTSLNLQECHEIGAEGVACLTKLSGLRDLNLLDCPGSCAEVVESISKLPFLMNLAVG